MALEKRIIGGREAKEGEFPFVAHLSYARDKRPLQCVGTIIHNKVIVVPAYCVVHPDTLKMIHHDELLIGYGSTERSKLRHVRVIKIAVDPQYSPRQMRNDIALLQVEPLDFKLPGVDRIPIYSGTVKEKQQMDVMGWGVDTPAGGQWSEKLLTTSVRIGSQKRCQKSRNYNGVEGRVLCTDNQLYPGHDLCDGEFGASLVAKVDGHYQLVGMYSYHIDLSPQGYDRCAKNSSLAYYTHMAGYLDFIAAMTNVPVDQFSAPLNGYAEHTGHKHSRSLGGGVIAGIVVGSVAAVLLGFIFIRMWKVHQAKTRTRWGQTYELATHAFDIANDSSSDDEDDASSH
ncbi:hypothetical protein GGI12_001352 [Dipsacomyces acuminosporus]|nr:hypothetical protein GGI12_001352 [Dipsacomyces acuminosporus]